MSCIFPQKALFSQSKVNIIVNWGFTDSVMFVIVTVVNWGSGLSDISLYIQLAFIQGTQSKAQYKVTQQIRYRKG